MADDVTFDSLLSKNKLLDPDGPVCLIVQATMGIAAGLDRFQPAGFPEIGHVIYDAPRTDKEGKLFIEKVCIVDSPASMANHLEQVCLAGENDPSLHDDLNSLPYVKCVTCEMRHRPRSASRGRTAGPVGHDHLDRGPPPRLRLLP